MFGKESEMRTEESKLSTIIARGTKITGNIEMQGSLRIDGHIKGQVNSSETLTVGGTGVVEGEVKVKEAIIGGKVKGNLVASQRVELESKASILGDVKTRVFVIKEGGMFHGNCSMQEEVAEKDKPKEKDQSLKMELKPQPGPLSETSKPEGLKPLGGGSRQGKV